MFVFLDSNILGKATNPMLKAESKSVNNWLDKLLESGDKIVIPEIIDYEIRRELLRASKIDGIKRLNELVNGLIFLPIDSKSMQKAAEIWAMARKKGRITSSSKSIDIDVILAAQAITFSDKQRHVVVATTNKRHLSWFVNAMLWTEIST